MTVRYPEAMYYPTVELSQVGPDCDVFAQVPYLRGLRMSAPQVIYQPPTVGALRAAGVPGGLGGGGSGEDLEAGRDLPVITLSVECGPSRGVSASTSGLYTAGFLRPPERDGVDGLVEEFQRFRRTPSDQGYWSEEYWKAIQADDTKNNSKTNNEGSGGGIRSTRTPSVRTSQSQPPPQRRRPQGTNNGGGMCFPGNCLAPAVRQPRRTPQKRGGTNTSGGPARSEQVKLLGMHPMLTPPSDTPSNSISSNIWPKATKTTYRSDVRIKRGRAARATSRNVTEVGQQKQKKGVTTDDNSRLPKHLRGGKEVTSPVESHSMRASASRMSYGRCTVRCVHSPSNVNSYRPSVHCVDDVDPLSGRSSFVHSVYYYDGVDPPSTKSSFVRSLYCVDDMHPQSNSSSFAQSVRLPESGLIAQYSGGGGGGGDPIEYPNHVFPPAQAGVQVTRKETAATARVGSSLAAPGSPLAGTSGAANATMSTNTYSSLAFTSRKESTTQKPSLVSFGQNNSGALKSAVIEQKESTSAANADNVPSEKDNGSSGLPVEISRSKDQPTEPTVLLQNDNKPRTSCCVLM
ncbi:uncharacterized protein TM35_000221590 [Trypanosoma theileri]|uniref:Uncharacterized protein n=1 Tax=Trypanosoma theileri TaxID=67003 RepID=A0A1X0NTC1_9TRYP|nr:uncharacterized protein TM35_000221590 [Trypanosoma theileri]ORC87360.1 hypothetical protein TM35_000221590 [Trypanosoma theileri]